MGKQRRILMCLEQLNIGGVETAVLTLCKGYVKAGHKVFVAARSGIFNKQLEKLGVEILDIDHEIKNNYVLDRKDELVEFCKKNEITEIHIHQYPCVIYWLPVIMELKIPYVAYVHSIIPGAPEWFMRDFPVFRTALPIFFENASRVVCIAESTKRDIASLFSIDEEKYLIIPNSLYIDDFDIPAASGKLQNFGFIARFSEEKMASIKKAIEVFQAYSTNCEDNTFTIAGDGPMMDEIKQLTKNDSRIKLIGSIDNAAEFMSHIDVYLGVDRTVLEAVACKRLTIISSYSGNATLLTGKNIESASLENFSGKNLDATDSLIDQLHKITKNDYKKITNENYQYINQKYNVNNNLYNDILCNNYSHEYNVLFQNINDYVAEIDELKATIDNTIAEKNKRFIVRVVNKLKRILSRIKRTIFR